MPIPEGINNIISVKSARQVYIIMHWYCDKLTNINAYIYSICNIDIDVIQVTYPLGRITYKHVAIYWRSKLL